MLHCQATHQLLAFQLLSFQLSAFQLSALSAVRLTAPLLAWLLGLQLPSCRRSPVQ